MEDGVDSTDVREEGIAQALAFVGSFNQTGNVHNVEVRRYLAPCRKKKKRQSLVSLFLWYPFGLEKQQVMAPLRLFVKKVVRAEGLVVVKTAAGADHGWMHSERM